MAPEETIARMEIGQANTVAPVPQLGVPAKRAFSVIRRTGPWRDALLRRMLALGDVCAASLASVSFDFSNHDVQRAVWAALLVPAWVLLAKLFGLYDRDQAALRHLTVDELPALALWAISGAGAVSLVLQITPAGAPSSGDSTRAATVAFAVAFCLRAAARCAWRRLTPKERALIVGDGPLAAATRRKLELFPDIHMCPARAEPMSLDEIRGSVENVQNLAVDRVIVATEALDEKLIAQLIAACRREAIKFSLIPPLRGMFGTAARLSHVADLPVLQYNTWDISRSTLLLKRSLDVSLGAILLVVAFPLLLLIAAAVVIDSRGPALFAQIRVGEGGRRFRMLKFRTMVANAEELLAALVPLDELRVPMFKLEGDPRVTRVGRILRRTSLDELPQLLNIVKGEMSLVGPRPEQIELVERYTPEQLFRLAVKPGLSGPMQVYGRGQLTFEERLAVERDYIENLSLGRDLRIIGLTLPAVLGGRGAF